MKYVEKYLREVIKVEPLGELTTKEETIGDLSGEVIYIDGKCTDIFVSHADYINWIEKQDNEKKDFHERYKKVAKSDWFKKSYEGKSCGMIINKNGCKPKFKVGDWIVDNRSKDTFFLKSVNSGYCSLEDAKGNIYSPCLPFESDFHLWTILDAKDGDVIVSGQLTILFKKFEEYADYNFVIAYAGIDISGKIQITNEHWLISNESTLASKEQRDLLFQKMREAGYEWDVEKKELKIVDWSKHIKYESNSPSIIESKQEWSEEDKKMYRMCVDAVEYYHTPEDESVVRDWLKSLKDKITRNKL